MHLLAKIKFGSFKKKYYLCTRNSEITQHLNYNCMVNIAGWSSW